jgi:AcrR family transcriptional regulator
VSTSEDQPTLRQEQQALTRQRLLKASKQVFSQRGYAGTTIELITKAAGTGRATFYLHFKSKSDALLASWREEQQQTMVELFRTLGDRGEPSRDDVERWLEGLVSFWEGNRNLAIASNQALALEPELASEWVQGMLLAIESLPKALGVPRSDENQARTRLLLRVIQLERTLFFWVTGELPVTREALLVALTDIWFSGA